MNLTVLPFYILVNCKTFLQRQLPHVVEVVRPNHPVSVTVVLHLCAISELVHRTRYLSANLSLQAALALLGVICSLSVYRDCGADFGDVSRRTVLDIVFISINVFNPKRLPTTPHFFASTAFSNKTNFSYLGNSAKFELF